MKSILIRVILIALAFYFVFPLIPGIDVHGGFVHVFVAAIIFGLFGWLVEVCAIALSAVLTVTTLGMALLVLIPLWLLGFWLLPAVTLKLMADFMPQTLTINGWVPAIEGGLLMLLIGIVTGGNPNKYRK
ncbi:hypothetical protein BH10CYA1_BH10CYA1_20700 [soil metagenome]